MTVSKIEELSKSRYRIYIDEEFAFVLYKGELRLYKITVGEELDEADYHEIMTVLLPKRAKLRAMNLLTAKEYTVKQLRDKLKDGGYPETIIEEALEYVAGYHYTDDLRYAVGYITDHESTRSRRRIEQDLIGKGIDSATLEQAWLQWEKKGGEQDEAAMIQALLEKKHYDPENADEKEKQRMYGFLMRKGFSGEAVRRAVCGLGLRYGDQCGIN